MDLTEQSTEAESTQESPAHASREDLIAAVREAGGTESVDVEAEESAAAVAATPPAAAEPAAEDEPRIAGILRSREKAQAEREAARNHAQELIEQARQESARLINEARQRAEHDWQTEMARKRAEFAASPTAHLRTLDKDPQNVIDRVLLENTPEARRERAMQEQLAEVRKDAAEAKDVRRQLEEFKAERDREQHARVVESVRQSFLAVATEEAVPYLHARYSVDQIFVEANAVAQKWREGGLELDRDFDYKDVAQYLDLEAKKRFEKLRPSTPAQQVVAGAPPKEPGNAPKVPANGSRVLSAAQGSERRTSPRPLTEMSRDEQRDALIAEVAAARRANPDSIM